MAKKCKSVKYKKNTYKNPKQKLPRKVVKRQKQIKRQMKRK